MSVGLIHFLVHAASALWSVALAGGTHAAAWLFSSLGRSGHRIRRDTSREGCGFPWFVLGITRFCGRRSFTKARFAARPFGARTAGRRESPGACMRPIFDQLTHCKIG